MADKLDAQEVENLSFEQVGAFPKANDRGNHEVVVLTPDVKKIRKVVTKSTSVFSRYLLTVREDDS